MYLLRLTTPFCLICSAWAGQTLALGRRADFCSIAEQDTLLQVIYPQDCPEENDPSNRSQNITKPSPRANPWTHEPKCIDDVYRDHTKTYCVYTSEKFANGRGISLFAAPSIEEKIAALPAFTQQGALNSANNFENAPWEIRDIPGKGRGLFATKELHRGDKIVADTPVGIYQSDAFFPDYYQGYPHLRMSYEQLPKATQKLIFDMAAHNPGDMLMERINTNAFAGEFEGAAAFLLYPETGKMNHDCRPNAMYYYDPLTLIHATEASRTILAGEEITITYTNVLESRANRQEVIKGMWGFDCTCSLCSLNATEIKKSDDRIERIVELQYNLGDWKPTSQATPEMAEQLVELYEQENLHAAKGMGYMFAALAHNGVGDTGEAKRYARMAIEAGVVNTGGADADVDEMKSLLENAKKHWSYMGRPTFAGYDI